MLHNKLIEYLADHNVPFTIISHRPTYTASQTAQAAHIPGQNFAKVVVAKIDNKFSMIVLPANYHVDLTQLKDYAHTDKLELAREYEFNKEFPDCEVGAEPPFGDLYGMDVYLATSLSKQDWVAFNAGTHTEVLKVNGEDFLKLLHPKLLPNC